MKIVTDHYGYKYDQINETYAIYYIENRKPIYKVVSKKKISDAIEECKRLEKMYEEE